MRLLIPFVSLLLTSAALAQTSEDAKAAPDLTIAAVRQGVVDMQQTIDLYTGHLGFTLAADAREQGYVILDNGGTMLVLTPASEAVKIEDGQAFCSLNFYVSNLDETASKLQRAGMKRVDAEVHTAAIGRFVSLNDPSGNRVHLMELSDESQRPEKPTVFNVTLAALDIKMSESFYAGLLGFNVQTRDYYPPVLPFVQDGAASFVLKDDVAKQPAPYDYTRSAWTGFAIECVDIDGTMKALAERGVKFIDKAPRLTGPVRAAAFTDPAGNVHELIEHVTTDPGG